MPRNFLIDPKDFHVFKHEIESFKHEIESLLENTIELEYYTLGGKWKNKPDSIDDHRYISLRWSSITDVSANSLMEISHKLTVYWYLRPDRVSRYFLAVNYTILNK